MSELSVFLEALQNVRNEMHEMHGRQSERLDRLRDDVTKGFESLRVEKQIQNGRVGTLENRATAIEERAIPVHRSVYGLVALMLASLIVAILGLVVK